MARAFFLVASVLTGSRIRLLLLASAFMLLVALGLLPIPDQDPGMAEAQVVSTLTPTPSATGSPTVTPTPPARVDLVKSCGAQGSSGQYPPGSNVPCSITIKLPSAQSGLALQDIIGGGGRSSNTSLIGPVLLVGPLGDTTSLGSPAPTVDQLNRVVYDFALPTLSAGTHTISYVWRVSDQGCYRSTTNAVHLNNPQGVSLSGGTSTVSFLVNCNAPITVGSGTPASCTAAALTDALALAPAPPLKSTIVFDCGAAPHTITVGELRLTKNVTIDGGDNGSGTIAGVTAALGDPVTAITLSGGNANRVVYVAPGMSVELHRLTITDGKATLDNLGTHVGGGVFNDSGSLVIKDSTIRNNTATAPAEGRQTVAGGGVYNRFGTMTIKDSTVRGNTSVANGMGVGQGGGVGSSGVTTIQDSLITGNTSTKNPFGGGGGQGGGIWATQGTLTIKDSTVSQNTAARTGGGLFINVGVVATIAGSHIQGNTTTTPTTSLARGGGITNSGSLTIEDSTISQNTITAGGSAQGGGIANAGGTLTVRDSTITQNTVTAGTVSASATGMGGGIATFNDGTAVAAVVVENTAITTNTVNGPLIGEGGGFSKQSGTATIKDSTITGNTAASPATARGGGIGAVCPLPTLTATTVTGNTPDNSFPTSCP